MSVFLEFQLPSPATWFYWSLMLAVALFFQFPRPLSLRNLDLLTLYLFVPGVLLVQFDHGHPFAGYICLFAASGYWLVRSLLDGAFTRRPTYRANLNQPGLAWFGIALFIVLIGVSIRRPMLDEEQIGRSPAAINVVKDGATAVVQHTAPADDDAARISVVRALALLGHAAVAIGLFVIGRRHFRDADVGMAMATLYLLVPYTGYHVAQLHHVLPAALITWAIVLYRTPLGSGLLLGTAAGTTFFPVLLFPVWLRLYWRQSPWKFALAYAVALAVGLAMTMLVLWSVGQFPEGFTKALRLADWQPWKQPTSEGLWQGVHWAYRLPVFIAFAVLLLVLCIGPQVRTLAHSVSLSAAVLIGVQFWYAERGGMYVLWYLPLLLIMTLRPTTADLEVPPPTGPGWATRFLRARWVKARQGTTDTNPPVLAG